MPDSLVLVTGGTGFLGSYCIAALLDAGYRVRTTVRSLDRADALRTTLSEGRDASCVEVVAADLTSDEGWDAAVSGCDYVLHVASPFPEGVPKDPDELIVPARQGALRVLAAAARAGVKRVVLTSSFAAIGYGHPSRDQPFTEADWTNLSGPIPVAPYPTSKTLAERAAWDFVAGHPDLELAVVNPVAILGPPLGKHRGTSVQIIDRLLGGLPGVPRVTFGVVDVRDVADLHLRAMTHPAAAGERFLGLAGSFLSMPQIAAIIKERLGARAGRVPTRVLPDWLVRLVGRFDPSIGQVASELGRGKNATSAKAIEVLGWSPRPAADAIVATAESYLAAQ